MPGPYNKPTVYKTTGRPREVKPTSPYKPANFPILRMKSDFASSYRR